MEFRALSSDFYLKIRDICHVTVWGNSRDTHYVRAYFEYRLYVKAKLRRGICISLSLKKIDTDLMELLQDKELYLFFVFWLQNGRNATKAYMQMHPRYKNSDIRQKKICSVLGHRLLSKVLAKVNITDILAQYDLSIDTYFTLLKKGLKAQVTKRLKLKNGTEILITEPDHRSVHYYHSVLGSLLGIE